MKNCQVEGCVSPVWGKGYCRRHQWKRQDKKPSAILKKSEKKPAHTIDWGFESQFDIFVWLWEDSKNLKGQVICPYTNEQLNKYYKTEVWWNCFSHILNKKNYPYFKLNPANIAVVFPEFHRIIDQGTTKDREAHTYWKWELWDAKVIQMKDEYVKFKKVNLLP